MERRSSGVADRRALSGSTERLAAWSGCYDGGLATLQPGRCEDLFRGHLLDATTYDRDVRTVLDDGFSREAIALDSHANTEACLFESEI